MKSRLALHPLALNASYMDISMTASVQKVVPELIDFSPYSGRGLAITGTKCFRALRESIASTGGNLVPVLACTAPNGRYLLGYGELRVRACLELQLQVYAVVEHLGQHDLFVRMIHDNWEADSLCSAERGQAYRLALGAGLFASRRKLAESTNKQLSDVTACVDIANLPEEVLAAFPNRRDIRRSWSKKLTDAVARDPCGVVERAKRASCLFSRPTAAAICAELTRS